MAVGGVWMVLLWAGFLLLLVLGVKWLVRQGRDGGSRRTPLDIAKERYAKGEITREEFEEMKRHLGDRGE
jgi:putative membrane protein